MNNNRILGFDLARAYAIFGMYIVNFNFCFGAMHDESTLGRFLTIFVGNSTSIFIILAGMGLSLMSNKVVYNPEEKQKLRSIVLKRSWFLFALGLLLYNWWPGDILHFYGGYMHVAAFLLFIPKRYYLWTAVGVLAFYHVLLWVIPVYTSWDLATAAYSDFWTIKGFLRNTFYNGWNSMFPWLAFFLVGMWLGRLNWQQKGLKIKIFGVGFLIFSFIKAIRMIFKSDWDNPNRHQFYEKYWDYLCAEYFPPFLPFLLITGGFALMVIPVCMWIGERFFESRLLRFLAKTGQMTLTHYVMHITVGMLLFSALTGLQYTGLWGNALTASSIQIIGFAGLFFVFSVIFSVFWKKKFKNGPLEMLMRRVSNG
jgi:uncharacterized protein